MIGRLNGSISYLVGGIQYSEDAKSWRNIVSTFYNALNIRTIDPTISVDGDDIVENDEFRKQVNAARASQDWDELSRLMRAVASRDLNFTDKSTFITCYFNIEEPTFGTLHEIFHANTLRRPILICSPNGHFPDWLYGVLNYKTFFTSWKNLFSYVESVNDEKRPLEDWEKKRWKFYRV